jgi:pantetheine-phosphate adenylyltransferase
MLGADLAILGQPADVYDAYASSVRVEYSHINEANYRAGRRAVLAHFLALADAGTLYADDYFRQLYGEAARENLARELAALQES